MKIEEQLWDVRDKCLVALPDDRAVQMFGYEAAVAAMPRPERIRFLRSMETVDKVVGEPFRRRNGLSHEEYLSGLANLRGRL